MRMNVYPNRTSELLSRVTRIRVIQDRFWMPLKFNRLQRRYEGERGQSYVVRYGQTFDDEVGAAKVRRPMQ
jgi:hypothetical protein